MAVACSVGGFCILTGAKWGLIQDMCQCLGWGDAGRFFITKCYFAKKIYRKFIRRFGKTGDIMTSVSYLKFKLFRIEDDLMNSIDNLASIRGEMKSEIASERVEWFIKQRAEGLLPPRYFSSPNVADYKGIWLKSETVQRASELGKKDQQPVNRVIYTAFVRYFEKDHIQKINR
ncbi:conserved hypothetical protein [Xenorhabdus bovienii str. kraussei Quebec]|uniref:Uncharacterized protein n=2 Tax=Xenorhabdus bovienii TaxID=40576 RepID=A0A077P848_XENBV|nr:hypothetical protein [Xenorhabdus bovienii]CDH20620.1 conserved hypothetical protein [Xenorhabdus bovienii str. kraussei Quebec]